MLEQCKETALVVFSTPLYLAVIAAEMIFSRLHDREFYSIKGTVTNICLMAMNMVLDLILRGICLLVLGYFFQFRVIEWESAVTYWFVLLFAQDFMYYLLHVVDHYCRLFWAVHVTHHSSQEFNLTVGFRSSVFQPFYRFIYFIPIALLGFSPMDIMFMYSATQIYGVLVHTRAVGKLGILEYFMVTPSHHRVHHGSNPLYLDKNMGMLFIIWDRIFGTFQEETEDVRYGLTQNIDDLHPKTVVFHEWKSIMEDLRKEVSFKDKLKYIFKAPGWSHDGTRKTSKELREMHQVENHPEKVSSLSWLPSKTA